MAAPSVLLGSYEYAGRIIDVYKNGVVLKSTGWLGEPVDYFFTKKQTDDYKYGYTMVNELSAERLGSVLYSNNEEDRLLAVHLDLWFGI